MRRSLAWAVALLCLLALPLGLAGCGHSPHHPPYRTLPRPTLRGTPLKPPSRSCPHRMGGCLPQPTTTSSTTSTSTIAGSPAPVFVTLASTTEIVGPDFSNNDPIPCAAFAAVARTSRFVYLKSVEGIGFTDSTAAGMAACAHQHALPAGGYDFLHVCENAAGAEASHFVAELHAQGLLGRGTLPPAADAEYPLATLSCNGRTWIQTWANTVYRLDGHVCPIAYSGAWWWQPHIGAWWPTCQGRQLDAWVSGYDVAFPSMPAGLVKLTIWQFADNGFNGYDHADLSRWHDTPAAFTTFLDDGKPAASRYAIFPTTKWRLAHGVRVSERNTVETWDIKHCSNPVRRPVCKSTREHLQLLDGRLWFVAHHARRHGRWVAVKSARWGDHRGVRFHDIRKRVISR